MGRVSTYLNFMGKTEEAFNFYKEAFGGDFTSFQRMGDIPALPGQTPLPDPERELVMHVELPTIGDHVLMGTDALESMGQNITFGNNVSINIEPDSRRETDRLFGRLAEGGQVTMPLTEMFWGGYFGSLIDRYGVQWMFNCNEPVA